MKSRWAMRRKNASRRRCQCFAFTLSETTTPILRPSAAKATSTSWQISAVALLSVTGFTYPRSLRIRGRASRVRMDASSDSSAGDSAAGVEFMKHFYGVGIPGIYFEGFLIVGDSLRFIAIVHVGL